MPFPMDGRQLSLPPLLEIPPRLILFFLQISFILMAMPLVDKNKIASDVIHLFVVDCCR